jgi:cell division protein FtsX
MINNIVLLNEKSPIIKDSKYISIVAEVADVDLLSKESQQITELLNTKENMTQELTDLDMDAIVVNNLAILNMINGYFEYVNMFIVLLFIIISLIVILNFSNLMSRTIMGRNREIGIMKIIGGSNTQISKFYSIGVFVYRNCGSCNRCAFGRFINFVVVSVFNWVLELSPVVCGFAAFVGVLSPTFAGMLTQRKIKRAE